MDGAALDIHGTARATSSSTYPGCLSALVEPVSTGLLLPSVADAAPASRLWLPDPSDTVIKYPIAGYKIWLPTGYSMTGGLIFDGWELG